jgi:hypothetical protein
MLARVFCDAVAAANGLALTKRHVGLDLICACAKIDVAVLT